MQILKAIMETLKVDETEAKIIHEKAKIGGEINHNTSDTEWLECRFLPNVVFIDEDGYTKMCVDALKILGTTAATDYGSSRQRDLGQIWADMTRGYLGEYAFKIFIKQKLGMDITLGHDVGEIDDFLPQDIHYVREAGSQSFRVPRLTVSIKTSKWNGIWLDIPGDQFNHSDIHIFVKVGTGRDHLFAFFKKISVFKDKVLKKGQIVGAITEEESNTIFDKLPNFSTIPAYICGFVKKSNSYFDLPYFGKLGRKNYTITGWNGAIKPGDLAKIKEREHVTGSIKFESIGTFSHDQGYLFNTGNLLWTEKEWVDIFDKI